MNRKILFVAFCMIVSLCNINAQNPNGILDKFEKIITQKNKSTKVKFISNLYVQGASQATNTVNGEIILQGDNFRLSYGDIIATFSKGVLAHYDKGQNTLNFSNPSKDELIQINPFYFIKSKAKGFNISMGAPTKAGETIVFTPVSKMNILNITTVFNRNTNTPTDIIVLGTDLSRVAIKITGIENGSSLSEKFFNLDKSQYPKAEIIDMR